MITKPMTNESLRGICKSNFELAHYAIDLGRYYIKSGRETDIYDILKDVKKHPDPNYMEKLREMETFEEGEEPQHYA